MKTIDCLEEALKMFEENSIRQAQTLQTGNYKIGNKYFDNKMKCLSYIYKYGKLKELEKFLAHENVGVRESAACAQNLARCDTFSFIPSILERKSDHFHHILCDFSI